MSRDSLTPGATCQRRRRCLGWVRGLLALLTVLCLVFGVGLWSSSLKEIESVERRRLESLVGSAVLLLDGAAHEAWARRLPDRDPFRTWDDAPEGVQQVQQQFLRVARAADLPSPIYTLRLRDSRAEEVASSPDQIHPGAMEFIFTSANEPYWRHTYDYRPPMAPALFRGETCSTGEYGDENVKWISAYAPVLGEDGRVVALLEADAPVRTSVLARVKEAPPHLLGILACFFGALLLATFLQHQSRQRELIASRLARVASRTDNGVIIADGVGRIEWVNEGFERTTGFTLDEVRGRTAGSVLHGPGTDPDQAEQIRQKIHRGEPVFEVVRIYGKDGAEIWAQIDIHPVQDESGQVQSFVSVQSDITKQKETETLLEEARDRAHESGRLQNEFLSNMGHELRTPLNGILGTAELLLDSDLDPEQRELCETSLRSGRRLLQIVNELLEYARLQAGAVEAETRDYGLRNLVEETVDQYRAAAGVRELAIGCRIDAAVPDLVRGDPRRIGQILSILLDNAIKFTERGEIRVCLELRPERLHFRVEDSGIGIPSEKLRQVFEVFRQADGTERRVHGGAGLGLALARKIVELMNGEIGLESEPGQGSCFWFDVPLIPAHADTPSSMPTTDGALGSQRNAA